MGAKFGLSLGGLQKGIKNTGRISGALRWETMGHFGLLAWLENRRVGFRVPWMGRWGRGEGFKGGFPGYCDNIFVKRSIPTVCFAHMGNNFLYRSSQLVSELACFDFFLCRI